MVIKINLVFRSCETGSKQEKMGAETAEGSLSTTVFHPPEPPRQYRSGESPKSG